MGAGLWSGDDSASSHNGSGHPEIGDVEGAAAFKTGIGQHIDPQATIVIAYREHGHSAYFECFQLPGSGQAHVITLLTVADVANSHGILTAAGLITFIYIEAELPVIFDHFRSV
jgi:hypothetical protein